ncbi:6-phosphogluconate dehydrogenase family protein [Plectosphaerella plurivora]|uniref:6-phosphogluconate dehydrogenase family protein n=1 Tax=Plectosphaerella plurivora TaxID=936078 RepID=A0A9P8VB90_9PEZI|nr:6-phosphogluconate dehydrogenase family protein [Plectosphaerella plurivora]
MSSTKTVGWFGLGSMGIGMAFNVQKHLQYQRLPPLHYSNRTLSRGEPLQAAGAIQEGTFEDVLRVADIVFTMISDDAVLNDLLEKALASGLLLQGKIWIDTSTVHPDTTALCSARLSEVGAAFIASPVFGASPVAAEGKLIFAMAGPQEAVDTVRPLIDGVMAKSILYLGEDVRKGSLLKITGNIFVIGFQELIAEVLVFAEKTGSGVKQLEEFIGNMFGPVLESYSRRMTSGSYAPPLDTRPGFAVALASKDARHAVNVAKAHQTALPTIELALARMTAAREYAGESLDSSSLYGTTRLEAGLPFWSENSRQGN